MNDEQGTAMVPSADARKWALICHLSAFVGLLGNGIGFLLGPLVLWLIKKGDDPFVDDQGKEIRQQLAQSEAPLESNKEDLEKQLKEEKGSKQMSVGGTTPQIRLN